jgi:hypothetical protein
MEGVFSGPPYEMGLDLLITNRAGPRHDQESGGESAGATEDWRAAPAHSDSGKTISKFIDPKDASTGVAKESFHNLQRFLAGRFFCLPPNREGRSVKISLRIAGKSIVDFVAFNLHD